MDEIKEPEKMEIKNTSIDDVRTISKIVVGYFIDLYPQLSYLNFRINSISPNNEPDFWVVNCSFDEKFGSNNRLKFELHVNKTGIIKEMKEIKER